MKKVYIYIIRLTTPQPRSYSQFQWAILISVQIILYLTSLLDHLCNLCQRCPYFFSAGLNDGRVYHKSVPAVGVGSKFICVCIFNTSCLFSPIIGSAWCLIWIIRKRFATPGWISPQIKFSLSNHPTEFPHLWCIEEYFFACDRVKTYLKRIFKGNQSDYRHFKAARLWISHRKMNALNMQWKILTQQFRWGTHSKPRTMHTSQSIITSLCDSKLIKLIINEDKKLSPQFDYKVTDMRTIQGRVSNKHGSSVSKSGLKN